MKIPVKTPVIITILLLSFLSSTAQLKLPSIHVPSIKGVGNDIRKVIEDYPNSFINLIGDMITENTQSTEYHCNFKVTGAEETSITRYSSKSNNVYSWQSLILTTESFDKAKQKFRSLYNQLNNLPVNPGGTKNFHLSGDYETPTEQKKFASVIFSFSPEDENLKKLKTEISLQYELTEWKVKVLVYDREREDAERGKTVEE